MMVVLFRHPSCISNGSMVMVMALCGSGITLETSEYQPEVYVANVLFIPIFGSIEATSTSCSPMGAPHGNNKIVSIPSGPTFLPCIASHHGIGESDVE